MNLEDDMATITVPTTIAAEATAYAAELGMEAPFQQMLDHIRQTVSGLRSIEVKLEHPYDLGGGPSVVFDVLIDSPNWEQDRTRWDLRDWEINTFPPDVLQ